MTTILQAPSQRPPFEAPRSKDGLPSAGPDEQTAKIFIVDDEPVNIQVVRKYLMLAGYRDFCVTTDPGQALGLLDRERPDVLLLDIMMPRISGLELLQTLRGQEQHAHLPVLVLTAVDDRETKTRALNLGATDFLPKPVDPTDLVPRVRNALVVKAHRDYLARQAVELERQVQLRTAELERSRQEIIHCLARAAEFRDSDTGRHVVRVGEYVGIIARQLGCPEETAQAMAQAAVLHDVGKIGLPDSILLKKTVLDPEEREMMQRHCRFGKRIVEPLSEHDRGLYASHTTVGAQIIVNCRSPILQMASRIALTHHEKWDGSGYPLGLAGEDIPLEGRITAVADVFDALASKRPYKPPFPLDECFAILEEGRGGHFDPAVLTAFFARRQAILDVQIRYADLD